MTKREIIDRRIDRELLRFARLVVDNSDWGNLATLSREEIKHILQSQGVVIWVERELSRLLVDAGKAQTVRDTKAMMLKWHNDSLEPLIEEGK